MELKDLKTPMKYQYRVGGSLPSDDPTYVSRRADEEFYRSLKDGKYCYVLNSRQMGKSSLRVRVMKRLQEEGIACSSIDLTEMGTEGVTSEQWYAGFIRSLVGDFEVLKDFDWRDWWRQSPNLPPVDRLGEFIENILLKRVPEPIVIFIDEIDNIFSLEFKGDDFLAYIRSCYNKRTDDAEYNRLTFALLGVATPSELIKEKLNPPFNLGYPIELQGFTWEEAQPLLKGLGGKVSNPEAVLQGILYWSGGQPFLTQKLCDLVVKSEDSLIDEGEKEWVAELVRTKTIENWESQDEPPHLKHLRDRLLHKSETDDRALSRLKLYQQILEKGEIDFKEETEHLELWRTGLVVRERGTLTSYNPIYKSIFDLSWVEKEVVERLPIEESDEVVPSKPKRLPLWSVPAFGAVATALVVGIRFLGILQPLELPIFDRMMRMRPLEEPDDRLLIVTISDKNIQDLNEYPITDRTMAKLLANIDRHDPLAIGLDLLRDLSYGEGREELAVHFRENPRLVTICKHKDLENPEDASVGPPPESPEENVTFSNIKVDDDGVVRRHLFYQDPSELCPSPYGYSMDLAFRYLDSKGIEIGVTPERHLQIADTILEPLENRTGFYQNIDDRGHQILLNYRSIGKSDRISDSAGKLAEEISIIDILENNFDPSLITDRIVLIGVTSLNTVDSFSTPYGKGTKQVMPGVVVHGHMVSQILSKILDDRPLFGFLPLWGDALYIAGFAVAGGLIVWYFIRLPQGTELKVTVVVLAFGGLVVISYGIGLVILSETGICLPFLPSAIALMATGGLVWAGPYFFRKVPFVGKKILLTLKQRRISLAE